MNEFGLFFSLQKNALRNELEHIREHSIFKLLVIAVFSVCFWGFVFLLFHHGFRFFWRYIPQEFFGLILNYLFALFYFSLFVMLFFSSTIIALSVFFHAHETQYLFTCPVSEGGVFLYKLCETFFFASWSVLFLGLPVCFAYGIQQEVSMPFYFLLVFAFVPFITIPGILGSIAALLIGRYVVKGRRALGIAFLTAMAAGVVWLIYSIFTYKEREEVFTGAWLLGILDYLDFARNPLLPPIWMSRAMMALVQNQYGDFLFYLLLLSSTALLLGNVAWALAQSHYATAWSCVHTQSSRRSFWRLRHISKFTGLFFFLDPRDRLFLEKDLKLFLRDPLQWGQFAVLLGLLLLYTLNLRTLRYDQQSVFWKNIIATLNLTATALTISTFATRFIFPMLSLEGKRFWALGIMPVRRSRILLAKFVFAVITLLLTGETLILVSCHMLRLPWMLTLLHCGTMVAATLGVAGLTVGLGAVYPNFKEDSPAKIVSGFGGTLNLVLGLCFVLILVFLQTVPAQGAMHGRISPYILYASSTLAALLTAIACGVPLYLGIRSFHRAEL